MSVTPQPLNLNGELVQCVWMFALLR